MNAGPDTSRRSTRSLTVGGSLALSAVLALSVSGCADSRTKAPTIASTTRESMADIAAAGGDTESARSILAAAAQSDPDNADLQLRLAVAQLQSGHADDAIATARQTVGRHPNDTPIMVRAAQIELRSGEPTLAAATFQAAIAQGASGTSGLNGLGVARVQLADLPGAEDAFRKAIALAPGDYAARNNLALALVLQGRADEAVPMLQSLADEPDVPERVRHNLALAYTQRGDMQQATLVLADSEGSTEASREVAALSALRTQAPTSLARKLAPVQVLEGKTSGVAFAGALPGPTASVQTAAAGPLALHAGEPPAKPAQLRAAPVGAVQAAPIAPPPAKVAAATPPPSGPPPAPIASDAPLPQVVTPLTPLPEVPDPTAPASPPPTAPTAAVGATPPAAAPAAAPAATAAGTTNIMVIEPGDDGTIKVRIAAVPSRSAALTLWQNLVGLEPDLFNGRTPLVRETTERGHPAWHLGTGGFQTIAAAEQFCRQLRARGPNCKVGL